MKTFAKLLLMLGGCLLALSACIYFYSLLFPNSLDNYTRSAAGSPAGIALVLGIAATAGGVVAWTWQTSITLRPVVNFGRHLLFSNKDIDALSSDLREEFQTSTVKELSVEDAKNLAKHFQCVQLDRLEDISDEAFMALLGCKSISMDRLRCLTPAAEAAILKTNVRISLSGLTIVSDAIAKRLANNESVSLNHVTEMSDTAIVTLSRCKELSLNGLRRLSKIAEEAICTSSVRVTLEGLTSVSETIAKKLAKNESVSLNHVNEISDDALMPLLNCNRLSMNRLRQISTIAEESIVKSDVKISLCGLQRISLRLAAKMASVGPKDDLYLQVIELSDEVAATLSQCQGSLYLPHLMSLTDSPGHLALSRKLGRQDCWNSWATEEPLDLNGLRTISSIAAKEIAVYGSDIQLNGLTEVTVETARALASHNGSRLYLNGVEVLSDEAAAELSKYEGKEIYMCGLIRLTGREGHAALANRLLSQDDDTYNLNHLQEISEYVAQSIVSGTKNSFINLLGLTTLSASVAKVLCSSECELYLPCVDHIPDEVAEQLRHHKHRIELSGLKSFSKRALELLRHNPECIIPDQFANEESGVFVRQQFRNDPT